jgi:hypothetical protein
MRQLYQKTSSDTSTHFTKMHQEVSLILAFSHLLDLSASEQPFVLWLAEIIQCGTAVSCIICMCMPCTYSILSHLFLIRYTWHIYTWTLFPFNSVIYIHDGDIHLTFNLTVKHRQKLASVSLCSRKCHLAVTLCSVCVVTFLRENCETWNCIHIYHKLCNVCLHLLLMFSYVVCTSTIFLV